MNCSEKQLLPMCAIVLLAAGCVTRTAMYRAPQIPAEVPAAQQPIKPASLSEYIRGVYKLSGEASRQAEQRAALLTDAPELSDLVDRAEKDPNDTEAVTRIVNEYMSRELYWGAYKLLTDNLPTTGTDDPEVNLNLAIIWDSWGMYDLARQYGDRAIANGAASPRAYAAMGRIHLRRNAPADALVWYNKFLELDRTAPVLANMGYAHMLKGDWENARKSLEGATELDGTLEEAQNNLAFVLTKSGDYTGALSRLLRTGTPAAAFNNLGVFFLQDKKLRDAEQCFQEALRLDPNYELARRNLAELEARLPPPSIIKLPAFAALNTTPPPVTSTEKALAAVVAVPAARGDEKDEKTAESLLPTEDSSFKAGAAPVPEIINAETHTALVATASKVPQRLETFARGHESGITRDLALNKADRADATNYARHGLGMAALAGLVFVTGRFALRSRKTSGTAGTGSI